MFKILYFECRLWCFNILLPALLQSPHPKPSWNPFKTKPAPGLELSPRAAPGLLLNHPVKFPGANSAWSRSRPQQRLEASWVVTPHLLGQNPDSSYAHRVLHGMQWPALWDLWVEAASSLQALVSTSLVATPTLLYLIQSLHSSHKSHVREQCKNPCDGPSVGDEPSVTQFLDSHVLLPEKVSAHNNLLFHPAESLRAAGTNVPEKYPAHANAGLKSILTEGSWKRFHSTCIKIIPACDSG